MQWCRDVIEHFAVCERQVVESDRRRQEMRAKAGVQ